MSPFPRPVLAGIVLAPAVLAVLFVLQPPFLTELWPFPVTTPLSYLFMASMLAAATVSSGLPILLRRYAALEGIGLDVLVTFLLLGVYCGWLAIARGSAGLGVLAALSAASVVGGWLTYRRSRPIPLVDTRSTPRPVLVAFVVFGGALAIVGGALAAQIPDVLPWNVPPDLSSVFGCMFLGAGAYFAYGILHPTWDNAIGQLAGFLAYDLVLIVPFAGRLATIEAKFAGSQWLYLIVVTTSGLLALWYLLLDPRWRVLGRSAGTRAASPG